MNYLHIPKIVSEVGFKQDSRCVIVCGVKEEADKSIKLGILFNQLIIINNQ
jgi:hypothetical protein